MTLPFNPSLLPERALLLTCSSHEIRCFGLLDQRGDWRPSQILLFHYDDPNPLRERNHGELRRRYDALAPTEEIIFTETDPVAAFRRNADALRALLNEFADLPIVLDVSVMTKRHLLMMMRWLDDCGCWTRLYIVYSTPLEYSVAPHLPLSFGTARVEEVPGFSATPDTSRPLHLVIFLGKEGDRAMATYDIIQPMRTTLVLPDPPYEETWRGRTESINGDLLSIVGESSVRVAPALDPLGTYDLLKDVLGSADVRGDYSTIISPLGTKPQTVGAYLYSREAIDPPAIVYTGTLRHNHAHFSKGVGATWIIRLPE